MHAVSDFVGLIKAEAAASSQVATRATVKWCCKCTESVIRDVEQIVFSLILNATNLRN